jgi:ABC-2 type transport system ATP-binding protein
MPPLLDVENLERREGPRFRIAGLCLRVERGEVVGLLGLNGAGKSTTLSAIAGVLAPTRGSIRIDGVDLAGDPGRAKRLLGFLPEQPPLYPELTVDEYLHFAARLRRVSAAQASAAVEAVKARCGLAKMGRRLLLQLSKGYRQRVGLAQAIVHDPPLVLLDEPTSGLDPAQADEIRGLIADLGREHGVILSSHLLDEVQRVCGRVEVLHEGRHVDGFATASGSGESVVRLLVRCARLPDPAVLAGLAGVAAVERLADGRFRLELHRGADQAALAEGLVRSGWGLLELTPEQPSLERRFLALTRGAAA